MPANGPDDATDDVKNMMDELAVMMERLEQMGAAKTEVADVALAASEAVAGLYHRMAGLLLADGNKEGA